MAKLTKDRIEETARAHDSSVIVDTGDPVYDKELKLTIHGSPVIDGRVRFNTQTFAIYNPMKNEMKKLFKPIYNSDGLLQSIIIDKLMKVTLKLYYMPTKDMAKYVDMKDILSEVLPSIVIKDNDNAEKVHFDILHDAMFRVILDDNLIIENHSYKYMAVNERVELSIMYCSNNDNVHTMYNKIIQNSSRYMFMKLHPKYIRMHNILDTKDTLRFHAFLVLFQRKYNLVKSKTYRKTLRNFLDSYPKELYIDILQRIGCDKNVLQALKNKDKVLEYYLDIVLKDTGTYDNYFFLNNIIDGGLNTHESLK